MQRYTMTARASAAISAAALAILASGCSGSVDLDSYSPRSFLERRYDATVRQEQDFTCGSAALATILTHYWGRPTSEFEIVKILRDRYPDTNNWKKRIADGFTFDDLAFAALVLGFESAGAKVPIDQLSSLNGPVIVHLDKGKFQHFSVLRKAHDDVYYLADPTVGQMGMERPEFERQYSGNAMAIWKADAKLPGQNPLTRFRDGMSVYSTIGKINRDIHIPKIPTL